jgi:hypothetical protein
LAGEVGIFDAISNLADEGLNPIVGMPICLHVVLVGLSVVLVRFTVES